MSTLITAAVLLAFVLWAIGSYGRLVRLRRQVTIRWREVHALRKRLQDLAAADGATMAAQDGDEAHRALEHASRIYNRAAAKYNAALGSFSGYVLASLAGFKRAELLTDAATVDS